MSLFHASISGKVQNPAVIDLGQISLGSHVPYVQHSYQGLTECPCAALDRFSVHGGAIRAAYENAVVNAIKSFYPHRDSILGNKVSIVVMGSGGLLQEAIWISKLYEQIQPTELTLHLVDTDYESNQASLKNFAKYMRNVVPIGAKLDVYGWSSCESLSEAAKKVSFLKPHLIIGIDTEQATPDATRYQWGLLAGDLEKVLLVKWGVSEDRRFLFQVYSRLGSSTKLKHPIFVDPSKAVTYISNAGLVG